MFNLLRRYKQGISLLNHSNSGIKMIPQPFWHHQHIFQYASKNFCSTSAKADSEVLTLSDEELNALTNGEEDQIHKLKVLILETEILRQEGKPVPSQFGMKPNNWKELLERESRTSRRKYLEYLFKLEKKRENRALRKAEKRTELHMKQEPINEDELQYHLGHNHMFLRIYDSTIMNLYNSRLIRAMQFSQKIVIDCGYEAHMTTIEIKNCAKQLMLAFSDNRAHDDPFDLHFCNLHSNSNIGSILHKMIPTMYDPVFPMNVHEHSYLDLFPKENLVYLTPHCREALHEFDHDSVYIIGAIVDKVNIEPLSLAKAKQEGLKMARLPLDKYLMWGSGSGKSLTINQVMSIMLDARINNDWKFALRHVPRRKLFQETDGDRLTQRPAIKPLFSKAASAWKPSMKRHIGSNADNNYIEARKNRRLLTLNNKLNE